MLKISELLELPNALSFRHGMVVEELMLFDFWSAEEAYYVCPRCKVTMEREFMHYCDRCGQCLDWTAYMQVKIIRPEKSQSQGKGLDSV